MAPARNSGGASRSFGADEKELEAIFTRTYGEKRRDSGERSQTGNLDPKKQAKLLYGQTESSHGNPGYMKAAAVSQRRNIFW